MGFMDYVLLVWAAMPLASVVAFIVWVGWAGREPGRGAVPRNGQSAGMEGGMDAGPVVARGDGVAPG